MVITTIVRNKNKDATGVYKCRANANVVPSLSLIIALHRLHVFFDSRPRCRDRGHNSWNDDDRI